MKPSTPPSVELSALRKSYGRETVVKDISLTIPQGEFFSLLGPSGSGKTTTLSLLAGFIRPDQGRIHINGTDATFAPPRERGLGMVFQNYAIFPHLDVFGNVAFPLTIRKLPKAEIAERVKKALEMVKLTGFESRFARQLSGGQQQRVALARAIVGHPSVVLMDEPLGALDKNLRYHMQVEIKEISRRLGMTVVYVTHDQEEALTMSDRIAIMDRGVIAQMGPPRAIYERPESSFVAKFLGEANLIEARRVNGVLQSATGSQFQTADDIGDLNDGKLFVRPEKVTLLPSDAPPNVNQLPGEVTRVSFLGNIIRYEVSVVNDQTVLCDAANGSSSSTFSPGDKVLLSWQSADARFLGK